MINKKKIQKITISSLISHYNNNTNYNPFFKIFFEENSNKNDILKIIINEVCNKKLLFTIFFLKFMLEQYLVKI